MDMSKRRHLALIAALLVGSTTLAVSPVARAVGSVGAPNVDVSVGPLVSGTASYVDGTFAWTDYAYDDRGPNTNASAGGDATYPASVERGNAADLIQLQMSQDGGKLKIRAVLETLLDPDVPLVGVGFDADHSTTTGAATIPGEAWKTDGPLGLESFITISSKGAEVLSWKGSAWATAASFDAVVDADSNSMTASVPLSALALRGDTWRTVGVAGLAIDGASWLDRSGPVYDLAFVRGDLRGWQDVQQGDVLVGSGPASSAVAVVDAALMRRGGTVLAPVSERGYYTFLYHSELALGEGINEDLSSVGFEQARERDEVYAGPYQPYLVYLPGPVTRPTPTIVFLHGREGTHLQGQDVWRPEDAILVSAFGRGPTVGYGGTDIFGFVGDLTVYGEKDVVDVLDDAATRLPVDPERVLISGFSMGAVGAFHIAEFYPDRFTAVLPIGGGDYGIGVNRMRPGLLPNLSAMPLRMANGGLDPLAAAPGVEEILLTLDTIGTIDYRAFLALERAHELYRPMVDCLFDELVSAPRVVDPPRVIYLVNPAFEISDPATGLDIRHDRAYWVSDLRLRDPEDRNPTVQGQEIDHSRNARIDVTSLARPERVVSTTPVTAVDENYTKGADFCGPNPKVRTNDTWRMKGLDLQSGPSEVTNGMTLAFERFSAITLDLPRMAISIDAPITISATGDGPATVKLTGPWPDGTEVVVSRTSEGLLPGEDRSWSVKASDGAVEITDDFAGSLTYLLTRG
jgi:pimeloyl-ACP methyl ester carboxylesterase